MTTSLNTIRKQTLQFQFNGNTDGFALQKEVSDWCNFTLIPEIEQQLEVFNYSDSFLSIDKLEIEATVDSKDWKQKIREELIFGLQQKLIDFKPSEFDSKKEIVGKRAKLDELILFYFKSGYLPWWGKALLDVDFKTVFNNWLIEEISTTRAEIIRKQLERIVSQRVAERIVNQVPEHLYFQFLKNIYNEYTETLNQYESFFNVILLKEISPEEKKIVIKTVYTHLLQIAIKSKGKIEPGSIFEFLHNELKVFHVFTKIVQQQLKKNRIEPNPVTQAWQKYLVKELNQKKLRTQTEEPYEKDKMKQYIDLKETEDTKQIAYNKTIEKLINPEIANENTDKIDAEIQEGIFIDNAGIVILAAFIPTLFEKLGMAKDGQIVNSDLAVLIIQYCVSETMQIEEYELVLPKILCGLDIDFPVNTNIEISEEQKKEVDLMLHSLIEYWPVLKDTSIEGLRESFLRRSGKLSEVNNEWLLIVDQKTYDMLLESLSWSISMIKLPWMETMLRTVWI